MRNLFERCKLRGQEGSEAFKQLVDQCQPELVRLFRRRARCDADLDDILQCTWLNVFKSIPTFDYRSDAEFHGWLHTIVEHEFAKRERNERRLGNALQANKIQVLGSNPSPGPSKVAEHTQLVGKALAQLNDNQRLVVELIYAEGMTLSQCADLMRVSPAQVDRLLRRAEGTMRRTLTVAEYRASTLAEKKRIFKSEADDLVARTQRLGNSWVPYGSQARLEKGTSLLKNAARQLGLRLKTAHVARFANNGGVIAEFFEAKSALLVIATKVLCDAVAEPAPARLPTLVNIIDLSDSIQWLIEKLEPLDLSVLLEELKLERIRLGGVRDRLQRLSVSADKDQSLAAYTTVQDAAIENGLLNGQKRRDPGELDNVWLRDYETLRTDFGEFTRRLLDQQQELSTKTDSVLRCTLDLGRAKKEHLRKLLERVRLFNASLAPR